MWSPARPLNPSGTNTVSDGRAPRPQVLVPSRPAPNRRSTSTLQRTSPRHDASSFSIQSGACRVNESYMVWIRLWLETGSVNFRLDWACSASGVKPKSSFPASGAKSSSSASTQRSTQRRPQFRANFELLCSDAGGGRANPLAAVSQPAAPSRLQSGIDRSTRSAIGIFRLRRRHRDLGWCRKS